MKKIFILFIIVFGLIDSKPSFAQRTFTSNYINSNELMTDALGRPIYLQVNYNIEGSPFYPEEYFLASLCAQSGKIFRAVPAKFNMMDNLLLIKKNDTELVASTPINRIVFTDTSRNNFMSDRVFEKGFPIIEKQTDKTWYEVLDSGKAKFLKLRVSSYEDNRGYGQASITRLFSFTESYWIYMDGKMVKLSHSRDAILDLLAAKKSELYAYIQEKKLNLKKEADMILVVDHFNSLSN
jgi:hypothetical protein